MNVLETKLRPADVVFDVGAYCGVWAMLLARHAREVVAFEPNPGTFVQLDTFDHVAQTRPARLGSADPSRLHVIYERRSEAR